MSTHHTHTRECKWWLVIMSGNYKDSNHRNQGQGSHYYSDSRRGRYSQGRARNSNQFHGGGGGGRARDYRRGGSHDDAGGSRHQRVDNDGDVMMGDDNNTAVGLRFNPYNYKSRGHKGRQQNRGGHNRDFNPQRTEKWNKVLIPNARRIDKIVLLKTIADHCPVPLVPYNFHYHGQAAVFYFKDMSVDIAIRKMRDQVSIGDFKLKVIVRAEDEVLLRINDDILKSLGNCVLRRYSPENSFLNLQKFHLDPGLISEGYIACLKQYNVMVTVAKLINELIPQINCLDLSGNDLSTLDQFDKFVQKKIFNNLHILDLSGNKLENMYTLNTFSSFPLQELNTTGNYLRLQRRDRTEFVEGVRKRFPKLLKLDGQELPPQIGFDVESPVNLPETKDSYFVSAQGRDIAINFFQRYFSLYDSNREEVVDAYSNNALFSLVTTKTDKQQSSIYLRNSRNLSRIKTEEKMKYLFTGKFNIMQILSELPKTQHDSSSMTLDVIFSNDNFTSVTISGVFKEVLANNDSPLRGFTRSFILIPLGGGFKIINEMLLIITPTDTQRRNSFKSAAPTPSPSPVPSTSTGVESDVIKQQMVSSFSQQSGMTPEWSIRCLQELNWDFDKAAQAFTQLNASGGIPSEAFVHIVAP